MLDKLLQTIYEISEIGKYPASFIVWALPVNDAVERVLGGVLSFFFGISIITLAIVGLWTII